MFFCVCVSGNDYNDFPHTHVDCGRHWHRVLYLYNLNTYSCVFFFFDVNPNGKFSEISKNKILPKYTRFNYNNFNPSPIENVEEDSVSHLLLLEKFQLQFGELEFGDEN